MAYPTNIREQALMYCQRGLTDDAISAKLGVSPFTLRNWKKQLFITGSLDKKKVKRKSGKPYKYKPEKIKELLEKKPKPEKSAADKSSKSDKAAKADNLIFFSHKPKKKKKKKFKI